MHRITSVFELFNQIGRDLIVSRYTVNAMPWERISSELTQIKRHPGPKSERRQEGSLTHGEKTPEMGGDEHEQRDEKRIITEVAEALCATQPRGQKSDAGRAVCGLRV